jgi:hypothetical protein
MKWIAFIALAYLISSCVAHKPSTMEVTYSGNETSSEQHAPENVYLFIDGEIPKTPYRKLGYLEVSNIGDLSKSIAYDVLMYEAWKRGANGVMGAHYKPNTISGWPIYLRSDSTLVNYYGEGQKLENVHIGYTWANDRDAEKQKTYESNKASNQVLNTLGAICLTGLYIYSLDLD